MVTKDDEVIYGCQIIFVLVENSIHMISVIQKTLSCVYYLIPYLQVIEYDVPQCLVHPYIVHCFLIKQKRCWTQCQSLQVIVFSKFILVQTAVQRSQTVVSHSLIQMLTCMYK